MLTTQDNSFFNNLTNAILSFILPKRIKKLIYLSSLIAMIEKIKEPDQNLKNKINQMFQLCHNDVNSIDFPMYYYEVIWSKVLTANTKRVCGISIEEIKNRKDISDKELRSFAALLIKYTPKWLMYETQSKQMTEIMTLFKSIPALRVN